MVQPPAPSLRELSRPTGVTEGVSSDGSSGPMVYARFLLALKLLTAYVHRSTLPQSRIRSTAPSEREPGWGGCHSSCRPETVSGRAIFIAPTKLKNRFPIPFIGRHSLSLAFARQLPQGGSRERWGCTIHRASRKPQGCGRFSSPLRKLRGGDILPFKKWS